MTVPEIDVATEVARTKLFRPPEGIVKHGDSWHFYHNRRHYRAKVVIVLEEELA